jgi:hypothetical protein
MNKGEPEANVKPVVGDRKKTQALAEFQGPKIIPNRRRRVNKTENF